jgi:hypothetical protein
MIDFHEDTKVHPETIKDLHAFEKKMRKKFEEGKLNSKPY